MSKRVIAGMAAAGLGAAGLAFAVVHAAEPSDGCTTTIAPSPGPSTPASYQQLPNGVRVCVGGSGVYDGAVTARADQSGKGYVAADGDSTNQTAAAGYAGVENGNDGDGDQPAVVGCTSGDYQQNNLGPPPTVSPAPTPSPNHVIVGSNGAPPDPNDPCVSQASPSPSPSSSPSPLPSSSPPYGVTSGRQAR